MENLKDNDKLIAECILYRGFRTTVELLMHEGVPEKEAIAKVREIHDAGLHQGDQP